MFPSGNAYVRFHAGTQANAWEPHDNETGLTRRSSQCGHKVIEVANAWPHSSQDQECRMRPLRLNCDVSATNKTVLQIGQFGRPKSGSGRFVSQV